MAIGSDAEIGVTFGQLKDMSSDDVSAWFDHMRKHWHPDLMNGYSTVCYPRGRGVDYMIRRVTDKPAPVAEVEVDLTAPVVTVVEEEDEEDLVVEGE